MIFEKYLQPFSQNWILLALLVMLPLASSLRAENCDSEAFNPCCGIPHNVTVACADLPYNFNPYNIPQLRQLFGTAMSNPWCPGYYYTELTPVVNLNTCEIGTITRRFEAYNPGAGWGETSTYLCEQVVTIAAHHNYEIRFPEDEIAYCSEPEPEDILLNEIGCDLLAVSVSDVNFAISGTACYKIFRTYRVLNWCEYDGFSQPIVVGRDEDCDGAPGDEAVWVLRRPTNVAYIDRTNSHTDNNPAAGQLQPSCGHSGVPGYWRSILLTTGYPEYTRRGFWQYTQHIKVADDVKPVISFQPPAPFCSLSSNIANGCPGLVEIPFTVTEECSNEVTVKVFYFPFNQPVPLTPANNIAAQVLLGTYPNYILRKSYPLGSHSFEVHVTDGCGNTNSKLIPFTVVDCKAPTPVCINGLSTRLMQMEPNTDADGDGDIDVAALAIWATDFIVSPSGDCTGPVRYSISRVGESANINQTGIVLTCADGDSVAVAIYAWDSANNPYAVQPNGSVGGPNYAHCVTYIRLLDAIAAPCPQPPPPPLTPVDLDGQVLTLNDSTVANVALLLSGGASDTIFTGVDGRYAFSDLPPALDYTLTPEKDGDDLNGLTTFDLVKLNMHLAGTSPFVSPYEYIAADMDASGVVDTADMEALKRLLLMMDTVIANNTSWRFVAANYVFADTANALAANFPESIALDSVIADQHNLDFRAIKIGDLNFTANPNLEGELAVRSALPGIAFLAQDVNLKIGATTKLSLDLPENGDYSSCQFALEMDEDALELLHIEGRDVQVAYHRVKAGLFTVIASGAQLNGLKLVLKAKADGGVSEHLRLVSAGVGAKAFTSTGEEAPLDLVFLPQNIRSGEVLLHANKPNPFRERTVIAFTLPEAMTATLYIQELNGRIVKRIEGAYEKGYHEILLQAEELGVEGVLIYTLQTPGAAKTGKMVVVRE
ncbi:MAG: hypothetical protein HUU01_12905 [Saprospiraceae bacterium]|nr:hypothetical protein [Saprospiraceae bacterium]